MGNEKKIVVELLNRARKFALQVESGEFNPSYTAGKAATYLIAAELLASEIAPEVVQSRTFKELRDLISPISVKYRKKEIPLFIVDGKVVATRREGEEQKEKTIKKHEEKKPSTSRMDEMVRTFVKRGMSERDAVIAAFAAVDKTSQGVNK